VRFGLVGAGIIAESYAAAIARTDGLELAGLTDPRRARAELLAGDHGGRVYATLEELLADDGVDAVVNLTPPQLHYEVSAAALVVGKHVHSEKPLALRHADALRLVALARDRGVRLSSAPSTLLGEAQQTLWKLIREGAVGRVRAVYAEANWDRLERWHPDPRALYAVGPLVDVGVYPLTILTAVVGPVRRVRAWSALLEPERTLRDGTPFTPGAPDFAVAVLEHEDGVVTRLTASFYVGACSQRGIEVHGDDGSLWLPTWGEANSRLELQPRNGAYAPVELVREPFDGIDWSAALVDLVRAVEEARPHRAGGEHAAHVVEVLNAAERAAAGGGTVEVASAFEPPQPMDWAA
jgi:predicted dehydrogenase